MTICIQVNLFFFPAMFGDEALLLEDYMKLL
jgi:hypothetical protein